MVRAAAISPGHSRRPDDLRYSPPATTKAMAHSLPFVRRTWMSTQVRVDSLGRLLLALAVHGVPLGFVVMSWVLGGGTPYYRDGNETFASYIHARNLLTWDPWAVGWLTVESTDPAHDHATNIYTHNPNGPRYLHYLLFRVGIGAISQQVLILCLLGAALSSLLLWRLFTTAIGPPSLAWAIVPLALVLDVTGMLEWQANTYRVWTFPLAFGCLLAVVARRPLWAAVATFLLFQYEYGTALFVGVAMTTLALLLHRHDAWRLIVASGAGALVSLAIFAGQLVSLYGWGGLARDLTDTYLRRGTPDTDPGLGIFVAQARAGLWALFASLGSGSILPLPAILSWGVVSAPVALFSSRCPSRRFLAALMLSVAAGALAVATLLSGYFLGGFLGSGLPLVTFLLAPAVGIAALDIAAVLARFSPRLAPVVPPALLLLYVGPLLSQVRAPVDGEIFRLLRQEYAGQPFVSTSGRGLMLSALTGSKVVDARGAALAGNNRRLVEPYRGSDGRLLYFCIDPVFNRFGDRSATQAVDRGSPAGVPDVCAGAAADMVADGQEVERQGPGWVIMRVNPEPEERRVARDEQRNQDLEELKEALFRYHADHGRYPCPSGGWSWSSAGGSWIADDPATCGASERADLAGSYLERLPVDPLNDGGFTYGYSTCPGPDGAQMFYLVARLEAGAGNEGGAARCGGGLAEGTPDLYAITSNDPWPPEPIAQHVGDIGYMVAANARAPSPLAARGDGSRRPLQVGEAAFNAVTREIWRLNGDGSYTPLVGEPGQVVTIAGLGAWSKARGDVGGLAAAASGARWLVDAGQPRAINRNHWLRMEADASVRGWDVLTREAVSVERDREAGLTDDDGWLTIRARSAGARVGVQTRLASADVQGAPLTARVMARAIGTGRITVSLSDATQRGDQDRLETDSERSVPASSEWVTLTVHLEPEQVTNGSVSLLVELAGAVPGDRLDVRYADVYAGRYP